ncbi:hypothetical protein [Histophilus somni]|uniref:hypothetical protein n=1 Tax=Histophilus somni TaxID=731 RepID=UPI00117BCEB6|nr:hypothetical protein [Histophilus somni]QEH09387.1 hypothetical protein FWK43_07815 [Histophilus somni]QEH11178.1 hypothetical protein FWK47_07670 [Histophilus somni]QEH22052.1 hypothetical protein FWK55_07690 [Histophilus somni]QEH25659.1 hypothetical protein FWK61_07810 [Histophilus somni]
MDVVLPFICTAIFLFLNYKVIPYKLSIIGDKGIIDIVNGILQILSGFYIASLAAIATASLPRLDEPMKGIPPIYLGNKNKNITRRVFLTHLFGYLSFISLFIYFVGGIAKISINNLQPILECIPIKITFSFIYLFFVFNLAFVTILGLFFMIEDNINRKTT